MTAADRKAAFLVVAYSAKFAADTLYVEPPRPLQPTDDNLRRVLGQCVRPPRKHHLPLIKGERVYQPQTRHHTREWLDWYATEHLPPEANARLMQRQITIGEWEAL